MKTWTYTKPLNRPDWVKECTMFVGTTLLLVRQSGNQEIRLGETIYIDQHGDIVHDISY